MDVIELLSDSDEDTWACANRAPAVPRGGGAPAVRTMAAAGRGAPRAPGRGAPARGRGGARATGDRGGAAGRGALGRGMQAQPQSSSLLAHFSAEPRAPRQSVECPVCGGSFSSDKEVRMHVDWCLRNQEQQVSWHYALVLERARVCAGPCCQVDMLAGVSPA